MTYRLLFAYPEVAPLFTNGGIGTFVFEASALLAASGQWEVDILTDTSYVRYITSADFRNAEATFRENGIRLFDLDRDDGVPLGWRSPDVTRAERYQRHVARLHAARQYDLIEFPDWRAPGFFVIRHKRTTGAFANTQLVVHLHSSTQDVWAWQDRYLLDRNDFYCHYMEHYVKKYADLVLSPTEFLLRPVRHTQSVFQKAFFRSGYPMSSSYQPVLKDVRSDRKTEAITVACISRLELRKGQDVLAQAIRHLTESQSLDSRVQYVWVSA